MKNGILAYRDSSYFFDALWQSYEHNTCLVQPLIYAPSCSGRAYEWLRIDTLGAVVVDVLRDGDSREYWFAQDTHLLIKTISDKGRLVYIKEDYRQVSGVWFPYRETGYYNDELASVTSYDSIAFVPAWPKLLFLAPGEIGK